MQTLLSARLSAAADNTGNSHNHASCKKGKRDFFLHAGGKSPKTEREENEGDKTSR
jgi:hypothetical protein